MITFVSPCFSSLSSPDDDNPHPIHTVTDHQMVTIPDHRHDYRPHIADHDDQLVKSRGLGVDWTRMPSPGATIHNHQHHNAMLRTLYFKPLNISMKNAQKSTRRCSRFTAVETLETVETGGYN